MLRKCFIIYLNIIGNHIALSNNNPAYFRHITLLTCFCGYTYHTYDIISIIEELDKRKLKEQKELYQNYMKFYFFRSVIFNSSYSFSFKTFFNEFILSNKSVQYFFSLTFILFDL